MSSLAVKLAAAAAVLAAGLTMSGCEQSSLRLAPDFGSAVRQDVDAQIADPDAHYVGRPGAGSSGARAHLAQTRYQTGKVIQPISATTSQVGAASSGGSSGGSGQ